MRRRVNKKLVFEEVEPGVLAERGQAYLEEAIRGIGFAYFTQRAAFQNAEGRSFIPYEMATNRIQVPALHGSRVYYEQGVGWVICALIRQFPGRLWRLNEFSFTLIKSPSDWPFEEGHVFVSAPEPVIRSRREA